jgi:hypothetical protein
VSVKLAKRVNSEHIKVERKVMSEKYLKVGKFRNSNIFTQQLVVLSNSHTLP